MHEFGIVEAQVNALLASLRVHGIDRVECVHFRRGSAFSGEALETAFRALTTHTPLEGAVLEIDVVNLDHTCVCGYRQVITSDDLIGHMFICPQCGTIREVDESHDLELLGVSAGVESEA